MKKLLKNIVDTTNSRVLGQVLKSKKNEKVLKWILDGTTTIDGSITEKAYVMLNNVNPFCEITGNKLSFHNMDNGYRKFCGGLNTCECAKNHIHTFDRDTNKMVENRKSTWVSIYGVDNPAKVPEIREKMNETKKKNHINNSVIYKRMREDKIAQGYDTVIERVSTHVTPLFDAAEYKGCHRHNIYQWKCNSCEGVVSGHVDYGTIPTCKVCFPKQISKGELEIGEHLTERGIEYTSNTTEIISPLELDIYIPSLNIAIEFNGVYWHSSLFRDKYYHVDKYLACKDKGIHLIQIFEDDWINKKDILLSRLDNLLGFSKVIYARKCKILDVSGDVYKKFCEDNHLRGHASASYVYGLEYNDELVSIMSFSKSRYHSGGLEMIRFCNKLNTNVVGGASKLFKHFNKCVPAGDIITYASRDWSNGDLYRTLGFDNVTNNDRNSGYFYVRNNKRFHRSSLSKHLLVKAGHDDKLTADEILDNLGYFKIFDCGNYKFILNR